MHRLVQHRWFSLADLLLVIVSGLVWILIPAFGLWFTLIALLPWGLRLLAKAPAFQRTPLDWLMAPDNLAQVAIHFGGRDRSVLEYRRFDGFPEQRIWGVTASILYNLRERLLTREPE